jgi:hypothetical protein
VRKEERAIRLVSRVKVPLSSNFSRLGPIISYFLHI